MYVFQKNRYLQIYKLKRSILMKIWEVSMILRGHVFSKMLEMETGITIVTPNEFKINNDYKECNNNQKTTDIFSIVSTNHIEHHSFMIQRYKANSGRYSYHNDFWVDYEKKIYRIVTYIWYLNSVDEGGETEFFGGKIKIKPKSGTLVLFPASWTFPHSGKIPISSNKYIITGWIYSKY